MRETPIQDGVPPPLMLWSEGEFYLSLEERKTSSSLGDLTTHPAGLREVFPSSHKQPLGGSPAKENLGGLKKASSGGGLPPQPGIFFRGALISGG